MIELSVSLASNGAVRVPGYEQLVRFGYTKNRGVYRLNVTATGEWQGLTVRAFWHVPGDNDPASSLVVDGHLDVPASVTAQPGSGCITFEGSDGTRTVTSADLRYRVAENSGTEDGTMPEPGTPAWQQLVGAVREDAAAAEQAKQDAQDAAEQASASAEAAATSEKSAGQSAAEALSWAGAADKSAQAAGLSESNAAQYAGTAKSFAAQAAGSAAEAENSASAAAGSQQAAESSAKKANASAKAAQESATRAGSSASEADQSRQNAETAAGRAEAAQKKTEETRTDALDKIDTAKADALKAVDDKQASAASAVESAQKKALDAVSSAQSTAVKAVSDAQATATQAVQTAQTTATSAVQAAQTAAVGAVEKAGAEVLASIPEDYPTTVQKVEQLEAQKAEIDDSTVGPDAWSSKHLIDMLCPPIEETGNPVQCYPVPGYPLGVVAEWEPTQEGSGEPSPENIRAISGRTSIKVNRADGERLWNLTTLTGNEGWEARSGIANTYQYYIGYSITGICSHFKSLYILNGVGVFLSESNSAIFVTTYPTIDEWKSYLAAQYAAGTPVQIAYKSASTVVSPSSNDVYLSAEPTQSGAGDPSPSNIRPIITDGLIVQPGQTNTLTLPRTIYGGSVDAVTGEGQDEVRVYNLPVSAMNNNEEYPGWAALPEMADILDTIGADMNTADANITGIFLANICEVTNKNGRIGVNTTNTGRIVFLSRGYFGLSQTEWKKKYPDLVVQIAVRRKTPVPFTATGAQPIHALSGINTVLTDADNITVTGRADPIKRITDLEDAVASMT